MSENQDTESQDANPAAEGGTPPDAPTAGGNPQSVPPAGGATPSAQPDGGAPAGTPAEDDALEKEIKRLQEESKEADRATKAAGNKKADADRRVAALSTLELDVNKAKVAYESVYAQLKDERERYTEYYETEKEGLEKQLGPEAAEYVAKQSDGLKEKLKSAEKAKQDAEVALAAAVKKRDGLDPARKKADEKVKQYKQIAATIGAQHAKLKAIRDEITKAEQAGQYALAYWLLVFGPYIGELNVPENDLIKPNDLPNRLRKLIDDLATAEADFAAAEIDVEIGKSDVAAAAKYLADLNAKGEPDLREKLKKAVVKDEEETAHA